METLMCLLSHMYASWFTVLIDTKLAWIFETLLREIFASFAHKFFYFVRVVNTGQQSTAKPCKINSTETPMERVFIPQATIVLLNSSLQKLWWACFRSWHIFHRTCRIALVTVSRSTLVSLNCLLPTVKDSELKGVRLQGRDRLQGAQQEGNSWWQHSL